MVGGGFRATFWGGLIPVLGLSLCGCDEVTPVTNTDAGARSPSRPDAGARVSPDAGVPDGGLPTPPSPTDGGPMSPIDGGISAPTGDAGSGNGAAPDGGVPQTFRFVAIGDAGKGNTGQRQVAEAIFQVCLERGGCDFALMLGDNIYQTGVSDVDDAQWQEKFEVPYADLDFPFYSTLGNHDYGAPPVASFLGGIGIDPRRGQAQVDYTDVSQKFVMPDTHYRITHGPLELVSLNTTSMFWADFGTVESVIGFDDENDRMLNQLNEWESASTAPWRIAFGHHPYLSNGDHGNAGTYDGVVIEGLIGSGTELKSFFESYVLGKFDMYLCGHDHSLQDLGSVNGTELFVSGGGASHTDITDRNPALFQRDRRGFLLAEGDEEQITFTFVVLPDDEDGASLPFTYAHSRTLRRGE